MKRVLCLFLLTWLPLSQGFAQFFYTKGFIVTTANDTLRGEIREVDNQLVKFRAGATSPERDYNPSQLSAYETDGTPRIAGRLTEQGKDTTLFMIEQVKGYVRLYRLVKPDNRLISALQLPNGQLLPLRGTLALRTLTTVLTECKTARFQQLLNPQSFYNSSLYYERIVRAYNDCVSPQQSVKRKRKKLGFEAGLLGGVAANSWLYQATESRFNPYWNPNGVYSTQTTFVGGLFYTLAPTRKLALSVEGIFSHYKGSRTVSINDPLNPSNLAARVYTFAERYISVPITLRYTLIEKPIRFYVKAGGLVNRNLAVSGSYISSFGYTIPVAMRPSASVGYVIGIGAAIPITPKRAVCLEARFVPHYVTYGVTRLANSRSLQLTASIPILSR